RRGCPGAVARRGIAEPRGGTTIALTILTVLAVFYTLYLTSQLVLPIVLAFVLKMFLQPGMRLLTNRVRLPTGIAALCLVAALTVGIAVIGGGLVAPAADWISKGPRSVAVLEERLHIVKHPIELMQDAIKRIEGLAKNSNDTAAPVAVQDSGLSGLIFR